MAAARTPASRELQRRRIALVTRGLAVASVVATAIFGIAFLGIVASLFWGRGEARGDLRFALGVLGLLLLQMAIGDIQWREHLPWPLVLVHVTLATAVWAAIVALAARLLLRSRPVLP